VTREQKEQARRALREWALAVHNEDPKVAGNEAAIVDVVAAAVNSPTDGREDG
jgi:hypothetical protein